MINDITYNGTALGTFGCYPNQHMSFNSPEKDYELVEVLGRDGALVINNDRFRTLELEVPCYMNENFITNYRNLMSFLNAQNGFQRLEFSFEPNYFRKALVMNLTEPSVYPFAKKASFSIIFTCMPQRWLKSGENWISLTTDGTITNPTRFDAKPIIRIYGAGDVGVGSETITLTQAGTNYVDVDCDIMDAHEGSTNMNQYLQVTDFPVLHSGSNGITLGTGVTKVEIMPRWYEI